MSQERKITMMNNTTNTAKTSNYFTFDHVKERIVGSEYNFKMAGHADKPQYAALMEAKKRHPDYELTPVASSKKVEKKQSYEGLNRPLIEQYLEFKGNEILQAEYQKMKDEKFPFPTVKSWFLDNYKRFDVKKAKAEMAKGKLVAKKANIRLAVQKKQSNSSAPIALASNF